MYMLSSCGVLYEEAGRKAKAKLSCSVFLLLRNVSGTLASTFDNAIAKGFLSVNTLHCSAVVNMELLLYKDSLSNLPNPDIHHYRNSWYTVPYTINSGGENFGEFGKFEIICQSFTRPNLHLINLYKFDYNTGYCKHNAPILPPPMGWFSKWWLCSTKPRVNNWGLKALVAYFIEEEQRVHCNSARFSCPQCWFIPWFAKVSPATFLHSLIC